MKASRLTREYRLEVASRVFAAVVVGYVLTSAVSVVVGLLWPLPKAEALGASMMLSFLFYLLVILWVFGAKDHSRMWIVLGTTTAVACIAAWALLPAVAP